MAKILLHICCGPCAIYPVRRLRDQGHDVTGVYYNPNIHPLSEYLRRREALLETAEKLDGLKIIFLDKEYDPRTYFRDVTNREPNRCFHCYARRLEKTRSVAKRGGFDAFSSTLLYSKFQKHEMIASLGRDTAGQGSPSFLYEDFRTGWDQGVQTSKEWGIYRQQYCGCLYSEFERYKKDLDALGR